MLNAPWAQFAIDALHCVWESKILVTNNINHT